MQSAQIAFTLFIILASRSVLAEAPKTHEERVEAVRNKLQAAEQRVETSNKNLACSGDGECEALEMGERLCGGPDKYLIVSQANTSLSKVKAALIEVASAEKELNNLDAPIGCTPAPAAPDVKCDKELCVERKKTASPHL